MGWYLPKLLLKKTLAKPISAPPSLAAHPSLLVLLPVRSICKELEGHFRVGRTSVIWKKHQESKVDENPTSSVLMHLLPSFLLHLSSLNIAKHHPNYTYHHPHPLPSLLPTQTRDALAANSLSSSVTPWPFRHCFAQESAKPTFAEISNSGLRRLGLLYQLTS